MSDKSLDVRESSVRFMSSDDDNQSVVIGFLVPMDEASEWHIGDKITVLRGDLAAHDQASSEQIALKLEERADVLAIAINPYLNDLMLAHLEDQIQTLRWAAKVARGEQE